MTVLVIAEHNNQVLNVATLNAVAAASKLPADVHVLVAGHQCSGVAQAAAAVAGVAKVLNVDAAHYGHESEASCKIGINALFRGKATVVPGLMNKMSVLSMKFTPRMLQAKIMKGMMA